MLAGPTSVAIKLEVLKLIGDIEMFDAFLYGMKFILGKEQKPLESIPAKSLIEATSGL